MLRGPDQHGPHWASHPTPHHPSARQCLSGPWGRCEGRTTQVLFRAGQAREVSTLRLCRHKVNSSRLGGGVQEAGAGEPPGQAVPRAAPPLLVPGTLGRAGFPPRATVWLQQSARSRASVS